MLSVSVLSRTMRPCWKYLIQSFLVPLREYTLPTDFLLSNSQVVRGLAWPTRRVLRVGGPVVGRSLDSTVRGGRAPGLRSAHFTAVATLARFDKRVQIGSIDEHAAQRLPLPVALART